MTSNSLASCAASTAAGEVAVSISKPSARNSRPSALSTSGWSSATRMRGGCEATVFTACASDVVLQLRPSFGHVPLEPPAHEDGQVPLVAHAVLAADRGHPLDVLEEF